MVLSLPPRAGLLASLALLVACSAAPTPRGGPVVSPTGVVYEEGTPPAETRYSQTAELYLRQGRTQRAVELAEEGLASDPDNPAHYYVAGSAYLRAGRWTEADRMFAEAQRRYPAYELDVEPLREQAWAESFNEGLEAYAAGDAETAVEAWGRATVIYDLRPEAHRNLGSLLTVRGEYDRAIRTYRQGLEGLEGLPASRVLSSDELELRRETRAAMEERLSELLLHTERFAEAEPILRRRLEEDSASVELRSALARSLSGQGRADEARTIYSGLLSEETVASTELFNIGVALFRAGDYPEAARAFEKLTDAQPRSRDAWFNYANSLFAAEEWESLAAVGERLEAVDPLGESSTLIIARAHLEAGDEDAARARLERIGGAPVHVEGLHMRPAAGDTRVAGEVVGNHAEPGSPLRFRFTFYGNGEILGTETVSLAAPRPEERSSFEVVFSDRASAYSYELVR